MQESDSILMDMDDKFLSPENRERKLRLQKLIVKRHEVKHSLTEDPRGVTAGTRFVEAAKALQDDRKNRFTKHDEVRDAQRRNTAAHDERVAKRDKDRQRWTHQAAAPRTTSGTLSTPDLQKLKAASDASRLAARQPARVINLSTLNACVVVWRLQWENGQRFDPVEFNIASLSEAIQTRIGHGNETAPEMIERSYQDAIAGNHLYVSHPDERVDPQTGATIRRRGSPLHSPPTMFPHYVWPDEQNLRERQQREATLAQAAEETNRVLRLPFDQLQQEARKLHRPPQPGDPNLDRS